jgi:hypothetical protein
MVVCAAINLWRNHYTGELRGTRLRLALNHLGCVAVLLGCFLFVIFPYIWQSKVRYGHYFYNVNSTFYMWYDSWAEAKVGTRAHGDRAGWPKMPPDQVPSFRKYVQEHSVTEIVGRFTYGFADLWNVVTRSYGYANFLLLYSVAIGLLAVQNKTLCLHRFRSINTTIIVFVIGYFVGYMSLYAWYTPIASGNRFVLSLFFPAMLMIVRAVSWARDNDLCYSLLGQKFPASYVSPTVLLLLSVYLIVDFPHRISTMYGGG